MKKTKINISLLISYLYSLKKGSEIDFETNIEDIESIGDHSSAEEILSLILDFCLSKKESKILLSRNAISTSQIITLENLGSHYGVTRERIRQIEAKAKRKLRLPSKSLYLEGLFHCLKRDLKKKLFQGPAVINKAYSKNIFKLLSSTEQFLINIIYGSFKEFLDSNYKFIEPFWMDGLVLSTEEFTRQKNEQSRLKFERFVKDAERKCSWPVTLKEISARTRISESILENHYMSNKNFLIEDNKVQITNLKETEKIAYILRETGGPMNSLQVYERYKVLFSDTVSVRNIHSALGNSKETVIVERGTYCLYENISLDKTDFEKIKELVYEFLLEKNEYCSSKYLHKKIFRKINSGYGEELTYYLLHGILLEDKRFIIRRGLMVGLSHKDFTGTFNSLNEEVFSIIEQKGPISESDIVKELSSSRDIFGINNIINAFEELCPIQLPLDAVKFDLLERVIGDEATLGSLIDAIQINLIRSPLEPDELLARLKSVGFEQNPRTLLHIAITHENIEPIFDSKKLTLLKLITKERRFEEYIENQSLSDYLYELDSYNSNIKVESAFDRSLTSSMLWDN